MDSEEEEKEVNHSWEDISWKLIDTYFKDNPYNLVDHHLESYNDFFASGINNLFRENNPIRIIEREMDEKDERDKDKRNECRLYLGGKDGNHIYYGKPIIYDNESPDKKAHYMYPNDARLRNMTYGITIHYDVDVEYIYYVDNVEVKKSNTFEKVYLGRFPIMLQSNLCILQNLAPAVRFNMGECRNDYGGYFIIDGKEKLIVPQEKFADNMMYIRAYKEDEIYSYSADIRSVSEDASKPIRTMSVKIVAPSPRLSNNQIVVSIPNVRKPIPLFIVMRALGVISDKSIIEYCLLDLDKNQSYVDLFIPSIHDAAQIFNQMNALEYIQSFVKRNTITSVLDILMNFFLPHIGEKTFLDKAYFLGYMVNRLLRVFTKEDKPTDRDNFRFKRIEMSGTLIYDLFREYLLMQYKQIYLSVDKEYYYNKGKGKYIGHDFINLIEVNFNTLFKERTIECGFNRAMKGNWGAVAHTKRVGVVQDVNRLSWNSFISQLRKLNLPLDSNAKVVGPRLLNSSQWGYIDPLDTPDGANIGLHKHLSLSTYITSGYSGWPLIKWIRANTPLHILQECDPVFLGSLTKVFVNSLWIGGIENPIEFVKGLRLYRRNGLFPFQTSISFDYENNEILIYTDAGRLTRPIFYVDNKKVSYEKRGAATKSIAEYSWQEIITGTKDKTEKWKNYNYKNNQVYDIKELFPADMDQSEIEKSLKQTQSILEYVDTSEEEGLFVANSSEEVRKNKFYTHMEWNPSLILGVMGNQIIFPENNPLPRNAFSCGQSKQAVSVYHSNHQMRMDKMGVVLNNGQTPLVKSRYLEYINREEMPYGANAIVAIMSYTGYNVEDAILFNEGALKRGLFNTTYYSMYESREQKTTSKDVTMESVFSGVTTTINKTVTGLKAGGEYSYLDEWGLVKEDTMLTDKVCVIGRISYTSEDPSVAIDSSVFSKKGQLGYVDKSFITQGEEGSRIAKIRVREERLPAIGDKMASRSGQKGTIGLIIPEQDMPFTEDGIRPDLIINPHAIPSRMTIGQLLETLLGKVCLDYGGFGNCTAFETKGPNTEIYGRALVNAGFHSSGNQILYNGMSGDQIYSEIFMGPTYYMRLKHMVKDKINYRARGPNTFLERQPVQGRANDGGLRIGEMERDGIMAHGASAFLNDSFMVRGDEYYMAVCNKTGCIAIYNPTLNLFLSPMVDGPISFQHDPVEDTICIDKVTRFGRSFSLVRIPYSFKLLIHELQVMNVQMRIITEDNVDQLASMNYAGYQGEKEWTLAPYNIPEPKDIPYVQAPAHRKYSPKSPNFPPPPQSPQSPQQPPDNQSLANQPGNQSETNTYSPKSPSLPPPPSPQQPPNLIVSSSDSQSFLPLSLSPQQPQQQVPVPVQVVSVGGYPPSPYFQPQPQQPYQPYQPYQPITFHTDSDPALQSEYQSLTDEDQRMLKEMISLNLAKKDEEEAANLASLPLKMEEKSILTLDEEKEKKKEEEMNDSSSSSSSSSSSGTKSITIS